MLEHSVPNRRLYPKSNSLTAKKFATTTHRTCKRCERIKCLQTFVQMIDDKGIGSPGRIRTSNISVNSRKTNLIRTCRSSRIEGIQQITMKRDESISPSLFTFLSHLVAIHRD